MQQADSKGKSYIKWSRNLCRAALKLILTWPPMRKKEGRKEEKKERKKLVNIILIVYLI